MYEYPELRMAREDMLLQAEHYQPSKFWSEASSTIVDEISKNGVNNFRSLPTALDFFVPTYGSPGGGFSREQVEELLQYFSNTWPKERKPKLALEKFTSGHFSALSDYRVLKASDDLNKVPYLHHFSECKVGNPVEQFELEGRIFSRSSLNYLLGLAMLKKYLNEDVPRTVLEIGGGFGTLGEVLGSSGISDFQYIDVDIPPTSFIAQHYLSQIFGNSNVFSYSQSAKFEVIEIKELPRITVLCSWQIERLVGQIDLFVNFISFQEMEPHIVKNYLDHVTRLGAKWILLRNMKEGKNVSKGKDLGVIKPILGDDYLTMLPDYNLIARNVIPFGFETVDNFNSELILLKKKNE
jgi:putative sugar O-methyltransferase